MNGWGSVEVPTVGRQPLLAETARIIAPGRDDRADVTVVIPTIPGRQDLLDRAVASVWNQTVTPQLVVVYDEHHRGAAWARNTGLANVQTAWTAWLDDDDELLPNHLQVLLATARDNHRTGGHADLVYSYAEFPDSRDPLATVHQGRLVPEPIGVPFGPEQEKWLRFRGNFIPVTYLARTQLLKDVGGMPPSGGPGREEDYQLLIKLLDAGAQFVHVGRRTWVYHVHGRNTGGGWPGTGASNKEAFRP